MSISNRVQRLEDLIATGGRMIVCSQPRDMTDEQLEQYLTGQGISTQSDDLVVSLKRFCDGHPNPWVKIDGRDA